MTFDLKTFIVLFISFAFLSCNKEQLLLESEIELIEQYLSDHQIQAQQDQEAFFYYQITDLSADSISPMFNAGLSVEVVYNLKDLDGNTFKDTGTASEIIALDDAIIGWQLALPKMNIEDRMLLFLPSRLAYGEQGNGSIPANTILIFDIELVNIHPHF